MSALSIGAAMGAPATLIGMGAGALDTVPHVFEGGDWRLEDDVAAGGTALIDVLTMPGDGGLPITGLEYRVGDGPALPLGTGPGRFPVPGLTDGTVTEISLRAVNELGPGRWSPAKFVVTSGPEAGADLRITGEGTIEISATAAQIEVTIVEPSVFAGTYPVEIAALDAGPVPLFAPRVSGPAEPIPGEMLTLARGLWFYRGETEPVPEIRWQADGIDIQGEGDALVLTNAEAETTVRVVEVLTDDHGTVADASNAVPVGPVPVIADAFSAGDGTELTAYTGPRNQAYISDTAASDAIKIRRGRLQAWGGFDVGAARSGPSAIGQRVAAQMRLGNNAQQYSQAGIMVHTTDGLNGILMSKYEGGPLWRLYRLVEGARTQLAEWSDPAHAALETREIELIYDVQAGLYRAFVDGAEVMMAADTTFDGTGGAPGLYVRKGRSDHDANNAIDNFLTESLS